MHCLRRGDDTPSELSVRGQKCTAQPLVAARKNPLDLSMGSVKAWLLYDDGNCDGNVAKLKKIAGVEPHLFVYTPTYKCNQVPLQIDVSRANILDKNVIVVTHIEEMQKNNQ